MSSSAAILLQGTIYGLPGAQGIGPFTISSNAPVGEWYPIALASGDNSITVPTAITPTVVIIQPPVGNATAIKFRTVNGDTGTNISPSNPSMFSLDSGHLPTTIYLNAASSISSATYVIFI